MKVDFVGKVSTRIATSVRSSFSSAIQAEICRAIPFESETSARASCTYSTRTRSLLVFCVDRSDQHAHADRRRDRGTFLSPIPPRFARSSAFHLRDRVDIGPFRIARVDRCAFIAAACDGSRTSIGGTM
jgi:hypothetical protein